MFRTKRGNEIYTIVYRHTAWLRIQVGNRNTHDTIPVKYAIDHFVIFP